ncbi:MAG: helix-turn-helix transcriptional regulator [Eggerthellaceae bacterium]|nr:helix-turn-helix transcriptional regulator [Eggerthellaceae bacterium]
MQNIYNIEQLGAHLKRVRKEKGISQADYADVIGVSHATLSALENGKGVSTTTLEKALQFLGLRIIVLPKSDQVVPAPPNSPHKGNSHV